MTTRIELGDVAKDTITGFTGVVVGRTKLRNNCDRLILQPREVKDGKPIEGRSFDEPNVVLVEHTDLRMWPCTRPAEPVELGDKVQDVISGLVGVATSWTQWLQGCSRFMVQPLDLKDGLPVEPAYLDELDLRVLERAAIPVRKVQTGGPRAEPPQRSEPAR